jgi:hypothetical protein
MTKKSFEKWVNVYPDTKKLGVCGRSLLTSADFRSDNNDDNNGKQRLEI